MNERRKAWKREDLAQSRYDFQLRITIYHALLSDLSHPVHPVPVHVDF